MTDQRRANRQGAKKNSKRPAGVHGTGRLCLALVSALSCQHEVDNHITVVPPFKAHFGQPLGIFDLHDIRNQAFLDPESGAIVVRRVIGNEDVRRDPVMSILGDDVVQVVGPTGVLPSTVHRLRFHSGSRSLRHDRFR